MNQALVSVVIPVRNRPDALQAAVESVLQQGVPVEVLIVDDASTDQTPAVAAALAAADPRVRLLAQAVNGGGGRARNVGIDAATAPWLAFLDSDDRWMPGKLVAQLKQLAALGPGSRTIAFSNLLVDHADGTPPYPWITEPYRADESAKSYLLERHQVMQTSTLLMPTEVARTVRFDPGLRRHQDIDFILRADVAGMKFAYLDEVLVHYSADPKASRVSKRVNAGPSLAWLEVARAYLSDRERSAFYLRHVFDMEHQEHPWRARRRAWTAVRTGVLTPMGWAIRCLKQAVPASVKRVLKGQRPHG